MGKGAETRERIVDRAFRLAGRDGLEGLTIGALATELGLSKSGLFAHFRSKEELQIEVLREAAARFEATVTRPAFRAGRGLPRVKKIFENWLQWATDPGTPGGCLFMAASAELDDREGRPRDFLVASLKQLQEVVARSAQIAVEEGHFHRELDCEQFAFELYGIMLSFNHSKRLLREARPETRARTAFQRLVAFASAKA